MSIAGKDKDQYIASISSICGEKYDGIVITQASAFVSVKVPDGHYVSYRFEPETKKPTEANTSPTSPAR